MREKKIEMEGTYKGVGKGNTVISVRKTYKLKLFGSWNINLEILEFNHLLLI